MTAPPLRLGLIGAGPWGRKIAETAERLAEVALTAVASRNPETPNLVGPGCRVVADWRDLVSLPDVEAVVVATPPRLHAEMTRAVLSEGKAVLVEKPLTLDVNEAGELLEFAQDCNGIVLVDHIHLYSPAYRELKRRALGLGAIQAIRSAGGNKAPFRADTPSLWDYGAHDVAFCIDLTGGLPEAVSARRMEAVGPGEVFALRLAFPDGVVANIEVGDGMSAKHRFLAVHFETDMLIYDDLAPNKLVQSFNVGFNCCNCDDPEPERAIPVSDELPLDAVLKELALAVRRGGPDLGGLRLGVDVVSVLERCQAALENG